MFLDICYMVLVHVVADAIFQTREMGQKKSSELFWWQVHIFIIFGAFIPFYGIGFAAANAAIHGVIDLLIWNLYPVVVYGTHFFKNPTFDFLSKEDRDKLRQTYKYWEDPKFYLFIIIDQMLHILTLIGLYLYARSLF